MGNEMFNSKTDIEKRGNELFVFCTDWSLSIFWHAGNFSAELYVKIICFISD